MNGGMMAPPPVNPVVPPPVNPIPLKPQEAKPEPEPEPEEEDDEIPVAAVSENASGDMLKNRVNSLLRVASDDDEEIDRLTEKKKRFGFFRK
jgi:hypothetical protein